MSLEHETLTSLFTDIANSIRGKTGGSATIKADNFPDAIFIPCKSLVVIKLNALKVPIIFFTKK